MSKRQFRIMFEGGNDAVIELDSAVIDVVDDEWRATFYDLHTPEQIAEHIGYNLIVRETNLSSLDGWADQTNSNARIVRAIDWGECEATEITDKVVLR